MADIRTRPPASYDDDAWYAPLDYAPADPPGLGLESGNDLETAVFLSLLTDRRAGDDELPHGETDPRGWWGDLVPLSPDYVLGSRLWLLRREKHLPSVLERARWYAEEALAWLVTVGAAAAVTVETSAPLRDRMRIDIGITRPDGSETRYEVLWEGLA